MKTKLTLLLILIAPALSQAITPEEVERLLPALEAVESGGRADVVGDNGRAVGVLQIHPITVKDCNRILGKDWFSLNDRFNPSRSRAMARIYFRHYGKKWTMEQAARCWNGGPTGWKKPVTLKYWKKVKRELDAIQ